MQLDLWVLRDQRVRPVYRVSQDLQVPLVQPELRAQPGPPAYAAPQDCADSLEYRE